VRITQLHATKVDSSQSRSSRSRAFDRRPLNLVALRDETRPAVVSVLPRQGTVSYFGCCCSVFGLAASSARLAIHASYSGVPRRGGVSAGRPPIACGIKSPTCTLLQDGSDRTVRQRNADLIAFATRLISIYAVGLWHPADSVAPRPKVRRNR